MTKETIQHYIDHHKFMQIKHHKRKKILLACFSEFSKGFFNANTDVIVQRANISKGSLFYYFGSKQDCYLFCICYTSFTLTQAYDQVILASTDFLTNIRTVSIKAIEVSIQNPEMIQFISRAVTEIPNVFPDGLPFNVHQASTELLMNILKSSDPSVYRTDISVKTIETIMLYTIKGFSDQLTHKKWDIHNYQKQYQEVMNELDLYIEGLKIAFYTQSNQGGNK